MSVHDIVTECAKYSLLESQESMGNREDMPCNQIHSSTVSSFSATLVWKKKKSTLLLMLQHAIEPETHAASWLNEAMNVNEEWTWPAQWVPVPTTTSYSSRVVTPKLHSDTSMSDLSMSTPSSKYPSSTTSAARTLSLTPTLATPTSPLKKDLHSFKYPTVERCVHFLFFFSLDFLLLKSNFFCPICYWFILSSSIWSAIFWIAI